MARLARMLADTFGQVNTHNRVAHDSQSVLGQALRDAAAGNDPAAPGRAEILLDGAPDQKPIISHARAGPWAIAAEHVPGGS
jgi:hypothetical protein